MAWMARRRASEIGRISAQLAVVVAGIGACDGEAQIHVESGQFLKGSAKTSTGDTLLQFCLDFGQAESEVIHFRAAPQTQVTVEEVRDERELRWSGAGVSRDYPVSFWCDGGGSSTHVIFGTFVGCTRVADTDPPATLDKIEPRGETRSDGTATGYALFLTVQHPGVLHLAYDVACVKSMFGQTIDSPRVRAELTIDP
jgi:hypothetical protein